jgi:solute carrier family 26 (sodium-independent sulfate anion transporter), member 11
MFHKIVNKTVWLIGTARNAIIVILGGAVAAYFYNNNNKDMFKLIGEIPAGLPAFRIPPFSIPEIVNETTGEIIQEASNFGTMVSELGSGLIVIPLIALLENIAICKAFANGKTVDATQELIAIGMANVANSFVQGLVFFLN